MDIRRFFLFLILLFARVDLLFAGSISISSTTQTDFKDNQLQIAMNIVNRGDESAYDVQVTAEVLGKTLASDVKTELPVNEPFHPTLQVNLTPEKSGTYPVILTVHYKDANRYPFSALTLTTFTHRSPSISTLFPVLENTELAKEGSTQVKIKNTEDQPKTVQMRLILPKELSSPDLKKEITLEPNAEQSLPLKISNFSALAGSRYPAYVLLEYESEEFHFTSHAAGQVEIIKKKRFVDENQPLLVGLGIFLIVALIVLNRSPRLRKR